MQEMTREEYLAFLSEGHRTGKLATVRKDGRPHVVPIWFVLDGDDLIFTTWHTTVKAANLHRDPRVCLCVDDQEPPYAFVQIEGIATIETDLSEMLQWATRIAGRYMGADLAEVFGRRNAVAGELLVRVKPIKVVAIKGMAD